MRNSRSSSTRRRVSTSECKYCTRTFRSCKYSVKSSAIFLVSVVTSTRSFRSARILISFTKSSIWPRTGFRTIFGSTKPVGRITCSTTSPFVFSNSYFPGVADRYTFCPTRSKNSGNLSGRLSIALGKRKPCSTSVRLREASPSNIAPICGTVTWLSSITTKKSSGK